LYFLNNAVESGIEDCLFEGQKSVVLESEAVIWVQVKISA